MEKKDVKKAFSEAENELKQKSIDKVKEFVKKTLEKLEFLKKDESEVKEKIRILKLDLDDLKEGRLDRIEERQNKDEKSKKVSVGFVIKKVVEHVYSPWFVPYQIIWNPLIDTTVYDDFYAVPNNVCFTSASTSSYTNGNAITVTNSVAKDSSAGTYMIGDHIVHFR